MQSSFFLCLERRYSPSLTARPVRCGSRVSSVSPSNPQHLWSLAPASSVTWFAHSFILPSPTMLSRVNCTHRNVERQSVAAAEAYERIRFPHPPQTWFTQTKNLKNQIKENHTNKTTIEKKDGRELDQKRCKTLFNTCRWLKLQSFWREAIVMAHGRQLWQSMSCNLTGNIYADTHATVYSDCSFRFCKCSPMTSVLMLTGLFKC